MLSYFQYNIQENVTAQVSQADFSPEKTGRMSCWTAVPRPWRRFRHFFWLCRWWSRLYKSWSRHQGNGSSMLSSSSVCSV